MSNPSDPPRRMLLTAWSGVALLALTAFLMQLPIGANAGVASGVDEQVAPPAPGATASAPAAGAARSAGRYQLRCWQYGRLLFDEGPVSLPADARVNARLVATDRNGASLIVTDAGTTTCLARPAAPTPNPALPR